MTASQKQLLILAQLQPDTMKVGINKVLFAMSQEILIFELIQIVFCLFSNWITSEK